MLFNNHYYPIDGQSMFVKIDLETLKDFYLSWDKKIYLELGIKTEIFDLNDSLANCFEKLLPLTSVQITRHILIPCSNGWIAVFNNSRRGTDTAAAGYLAESLKTFAVTVATTPDFNGRFQNEPLPHAGTLDFTLFGSNQTDFLNRIRSISLVNEDGNWSFNTAGHPLTFENETIYKAKKIRDRFNVDVLKTYLAEMGIRAFEEDFYDTKSAALLERRGSLSPLLKTFSIEDALLG